MNIDNVFKRRIDSVCQNNKDRIAIHCLFKEKDISYTYGQFYNRILSFKEIVNKYNLKPGDRIGLVCNNTTYGMMMFFCAAYWNICIVIVDYSLINKQIIDILNKTEVKFLITDTKKYSSLKDNVKYPVLNIYDDNLVKIGGKINNRPCTDVDEDVCVIISSSGTAGRIKQIELSYDACVNAADNVFETVDVDCNDIELDLFPVAHVSGLISSSTALLYGAELCSVDNYDITKINDYLLYFNPTAFGMIPRVLDIMISSMENEINKNKLLFKYYLFVKKVSRYFQKNYHNRKIGKKLLKPFTDKLFGKNIRLIFTGSTKSKQDIADSIYDLGLMWHNLYASSECGCIITSTSYDEMYVGDTEGNVDRLKHIEIIIADKNEDGVGDIRLKSNSLMKGYFKDVVSTKNSFDINGYFKTGDLGYIDNNRYLHVLGRSKDVIILPNGKKVSPDDLGSLLMPYSPVNNPVIICGILDERNGYDNIHAFFEDKQYSVEEMKTIKQNLLVGAKRVIKVGHISEVHFICDIPYTHTHKVVRRELIKRINDTSHSKVEAISILGIIKKYLGSATNITLEDKVIDLGLDSLSIYSISNEIKQTYDIDIIPKLSPDLRIKDLLTKDGVEHELILRNIREDEMKRASEILANEFYDYPVYREFYKIEKLRWKQLYYIHYLMMLVGFNKIYINNDFSIIAKITKPMQKSKVLWLKLFNPIFAIPAILINIPALVTIIPYEIMRFRNKDMFCNPNTDVFVGFVATDKNKRGTGDFIKAVRGITDNSRICFETHTKANVSLYEKLGFSIYKQFKWHGITYYCMYKDNC